MRLCPKCNTEKPLSEYRENQPYCWQCFRRLKHPEYHTDIDKSRQKANNRYKTDAKYRERCKANSRRQYQEKKIRELEKR